MDTRDEAIALARDRQCEGCAIRSIVGPAGKEPWTRAPWRSSAPTGTEIAKPLTYAAIGDTNVHRPLRFAIVLVGARKKCRLKCMPTQQRKLPD
jgi:hypothetical protein